MTTLPCLSPPAAFACAARMVVAALAALELCGCRSLPLQPPIDFAGPGWTLREGQAVWRPRAGADGIAGDLLVATHPDGRSVVQFTKTPLPFLVAQRTPEGWQVQFIPHNKTYSGRGQPPARLLWLHLPEALARGSASDGFRFTTNASNGWRFERPATGESLEGYLVPISNTINLPPRAPDAGLDLNTGRARCALPPHPGPLPQGEGGPRLRSSGLPEGVCLKNVIPCAEDGDIILPLPEGEGRGEGKQVVRTVRVSKPNLHLPARKS